MRVPTHRTHSLTHSPSPFDPPAHLPTHVQSKKGALWSRKSLNTNTFSTVFSFRISGQGKKFFGDGMALWFIQQAYYVEGDFHGSVERFTGFGIIFDTFKNTETLSYHRDISIVYNDGEKTAEFMMEKKEGCDAHIRYHEERGDFSVHSLSRAKVVLQEGRKVTVMVDAKNEGDFVECASMELPKSLNENWAKSAHIGVTASTGQLVSIQRKKKYYNHNHNAIPPPWHPDITPIHAP
jgi:mannose-binding lectin 2